MDERPGPGNIFTERALGFETPGRVRRWFCKLTMVAVTIIVDTAVCDFFMLRRIFKIGLLLFCFHFSSTQRPWPSY